MRSSLHFIVWCSIIYHLHMLANQHAAPSSRLLHKGGTLPIRDAVLQHFGRESSHFCSVLYPMSATVENPRNVDQRTLTSAHLLNSKGQMLACILSKLGKPGLPKRVDSDDAL